MMTDDRINLTIDGKSQSVPAGKSILETCRTLDIDIPTLCYDPRLPAYGSCLLCVVEMELNGTSKLVLACTTEAQAGMNITTRNEKVDRARKNALDMLLSNHYADCRGACYENCPANVDVQGYLALANAGRYLEALELVRETNPLPLVCGRVCVRYCEANCRRNDVDSPVAVNFIKRYISDLESDHLPRPTPVPSNGHKVAIVGGGPAGLTAGYYLRRKGYPVTIFEAHPKLGGMLRYGIPEYRLPGAVLDKEIDSILANDIDAKINTKLGRDFTLDDLKRDGFKAIFLAIGAQKAKRMRVENEDTPGVIGGIEFLEKVKKDGPPELKGHVIVVGGGNTAIDAARTALRCKADKVSIFYRRTRDEMPADDVEIEDAVEEGVVLEFLTAPLAVIAEDGRVKALRCQRMQLGEPDASGRRSPIPVAGSEFDAECTTIIAAIGQDADLGCLENNQLGVIELSKYGTINTGKRTFATSVAGVFAGGDIATGPAAAIDAIGAGRKAADVIDGYLRQGAVKPAPEEFLSKRLAFGELPEEFLKAIEKTTRSTMLKQSVEKRAGSFEEVDLGIATPTVSMETLRCLSCGCSDVFTCKLKQYATTYGGEQKRFQGKVNKHKPDDRHPWITIDTNKCVLCGLCVRTCDVILGVGALGFAYRGFDMVIQPTLGVALQDTNCIACGNCIEVCPTGAISFHLDLQRPGPWRTTPHPSVCSICGVGCGLNFNEVNDGIWTVTAQPESKFVFGELCARGRFGHQYLKSPLRITKPSIAQKPASLEKTLEEVLNQLKSVNDKHGKGSIGVLVSPRASNEEIMLARKIAGEVLDTPHVASLQSLLRPSPENLVASLGITASTITADQVEQADTIVLVNSNVTDDNPVLGFRIRRAARKGASIVSLNSGSIGMQDAVTLWLDARRGTSVTLMGAVARELIQKGAIDGEYLRTRVEGLEKLEAALPALDKALDQSGVELGKVESFIQHLADPARKVVFVYDIDSDLDRSPGDLQAIANLLLLTGRIGRPASGLLLARHFANGQGHVDLLGSDTAAFKAALQKGNIKGWFILGEDPAGLEQCEKWLKGAEVVVAMDLIETETTRKAAVVLPASAVAESYGSITSQDRRVRAFTPAFAAPSKVTGLDVLAGLYAAGTGKDAPDLKTVRAWIADVNPLYKPLTSLEDNAAFRYTVSDGDGSHLFTGKFATPDGKARLLAPPAASIEAADPALPPIGLDRIVAQSVRIEK